MTGIPKNTLIAWERRYGLVEPRRSDSGYRVYTDEDVAMIRRVKDLLDAGYRISEASDMVRRELGQNSQHSQQVEPVLTGMESYRAVLLTALLDFDRAAAERVVRRLVTLPYETLLDDLYLPILRITGDRWEGGEVTVVQEHFVSAWCREQILAMARSLEPGVANAPEAICATPAGEHHEFGLLGVAFRLANRGYRLLYLGTNVPTDQLLDLVRRRRPEIVALSLVLERPGFDPLDYGRKILSVLGPEGRVLMGGRAVDGLSERSTSRLLVGDSIVRV